MALRVWLPLNGSLENKGISNIEVINNGATINNNGKLGQCYNFNSNNIVLKNIDLSNISSLSVACWIKDSNTSSTQAIINCRTAVGNGLAIFLLGGKIRFDIGNTNCTFDWTYNLSNWTHICCTAEGNVRKLYVNGTLQQEKTVAATYTTFGTIASIGMSSANTASPSGNILYADLNDFRLYDHCLSAKEVKEISQGLVLHYKLNGMSGGVGDNLLLRTNCGTDGWGFNLGNKYKQPIKEEISWLGTRAMQATTQELNTEFTSTWALVYYNDGSLYANLEPNTTYTISFDSNIHHTNFTVLQGNGTNNMGTNYRYHQEERIDENGQVYWHIVGTFTTLSEFTGSNQYIYINSNMGYMNTAGNVVKYTNIKCEYGEKDTAWTPTPIEGMGIKTSKAVDSSGYENHSHTSSIHFVSEQGPRYNVIADFSYGHIVSPELSMSKGNTIAFWCSASDWSEYSLDAGICLGTNWGITSRNNNLILELVSHIFVENSDYNLSQVYSWTLMPTSSLGTDWHYFVLTYLNHEIKFYLDGILYQTISNISTDIADYFYTNYITLAALPFA